MASSEALSSTDTAAIAAAAAARPKRVRTGCLTCRERHLKCDEGLPDCLNCKKSNRPCKRGVRLNFIDTTVRTPPITPPTEDWDVSFHDESREIASEYQGGARRYTTLEEQSVVKGDTDYDFPPPMMDASVLPHQTLPPQQAPPQPLFIPSSAESYTASLPSMSESGREQHQHQRHGSTTSDSTTFSANTLGASSSITFANGDQTLTPPNETRKTLTDPEELLFMQVFVEEVGIWMDSMDPYKHVSIEFGVDGVRLTITVLPAPAIRFSRRANALECFSCLRCSTLDACQSCLPRRKGQTILPTLEHVIASANAKSIPRHCYCRYHCCDPQRIRNHD